MKTRPLSDKSEPLTLWRISTHESLDGYGGVVADARWNTHGHPVIYLAETPAGALLEILAHLPTEEFMFPDSYRLLQVHGSAAIEIDDLNVSAAPLWQTDESVSRQIGDTWLQAAGSALVRVPSAIVPYTWNYLLNPLHPEAAQFSIVAATNHLYDPRLLRVRYR